MRTFLLLIFSMILSSQVFSRTCVSTGNGNWESSGTWLCDGIPSIPMAGDVVIIQVGHQVTQSTNHTPSGTNPPIYIYVYGNWHFGNGSKIYLPCNSFVSVETGGSVTASGGGSSNRIEICNTVMWKASDGNLYGGSTVGTSPPFNPLPVELLTFRGSQSGNVIELEWVTASETNNSHFNIERSKNGYEFSKIGQINGAGSSDITHFYFFKDESPQKGNNYYRLQQVDFDGSTRLSEIISVVSESKDSEPVIFPNPASPGSYINFSWKGFNDTGVVLTVIDNLGRTLYSRNMEGQINHLTLPVSELNLNRGTYFVRFISHTSEKQIPLIIR